MMPAERPKISDELFLDLMLGLHIDFGSDVETSRAIYDSAAAAAGEPGLANLLAAGAIRVRWGRICMLRPHHRGQDAIAPPAGVTALRTKWYEQTFHISRAVHARTELATYANDIEKIASVTGVVGCQTPQWVAARLWDRSSSTATDTKGALREWVDRWLAMGAPMLVPSQVWSADVAKSFLENALEVLTLDAALPGWVDRREHIINELVLANGVSRKNVEMFVHLLPETVIGRALWLDNQRIEVPIMEALFGSADIFGLFRLVLSDVEHADLSPAPNPLAVKALSLAADRLDLLHMLLFWIERHPQVLADLLLFPPTAALACLVIARWPAPHDAWNRELTLRDHLTAKASAFTDAISVVAHYLKQSLVPSAEVAALLEWLHSNPPGLSGEGIGSAAAMRFSLKGELVGQSSEALSAMVTALAPSLRNSGLESPAFAATLDLIEIGGLATTIEPVPIVDVYLRSVAKGGYQTTAHRISEGAAATLFHLVERMSAAERNEFLYPLGVDGRARAVADQNPFTLADEIARSIRCHIRILCRVIVGLGEQQPADLVNALASTVRPVAIQIAGQASVATFAPRYAIQGAYATHDRPIAADIGAALTALPAAQADRVLSAFLETNEPMILAQILAYAPRSMRDRITKRLSEISPRDADAILSLTEVQARIETLLAAGVPDTAAKFIDEEQTVQTFGRVPGRSLVRLHAQLRLFFAQGDWTSIASIEVPDDLRGPDEASARDTIDFFRALTELKKPDGDFAGAEHVFALLEQRYPTVLAYSVNRLAAAISRLLGKNGFALLQGAALAEGRKLLTESESLASRAQGQPDADIVATNRALLSLAVGHPEGALQALAGVRGDEHRATVAAYTAVAFSRLGRPEEAAATLKGAEESLGAIEVLKAAWDYLGKGTPFSTYANTSIDENPVPQVKRALLAFLQMDPILQAEALSPHPDDPFDRVVIDFVRAAGSSISGLVPMMKNVTIDQSEDDLTAFLHRVLEAKVEFLGWTISDQSRGGRTPKGNAGERDLVLRKGSSTLAVLEAVVCTRPVTQAWARDELTMHFQKLLGYDTCRLFFHVTYAYIADLASIAAHLRQVAQDQAPDGFTFIGSAEIPLTDSRPTGFVARYKGGLSEVRVVFLILDIGQVVQQAATMRAEARNPRKPKKGSRSSKLGKAGRQPKTKKSSVLLTTKKGKVVKRKTVQKKKKP